MLLTPEHWFQRAENARMTAKFLTDDEARQLLLRIAEMYEKIAIRARLAGNERE